jgi:hypothetical protein
MANKQDRLLREVEQLRARVESLTAAQDQTRNTAGEARSAEPIGEGLEGKFEDLFQTLKDDLEEASGVTVLAVFALGLLVGRSLAF